MDVDVEMFLCDLGRSLEMDIVRELLDEWRTRTEGIREGVMRELKEMRCEDDEKENLENGMETEETGERQSSDDTLSGYESAVQSPIPVVKDRVNVPEGSRVEKDPVQRTSEGRSLGQVDEEGEKEPEEMGRCVVDTEERVENERQLITGDGEKEASGGEILDTDRLGRPVDGDNGVGSVEDKNTGKESVGRTRRNIKLNEALLELKRRCLDKDGEPPSKENMSVESVKETVRSQRECDLRKPFFNTSTLHQPTKGHLPRITSSGKTGDDYLYKQAIDSQLLRTRSRNGVPQHIYKPETKIPRVDEDSSTVADSSFVVPEFAKDPEVNLKVRMQDHKVLERYFSRGYDVDVEKLFPHVKNVSNNSPNKWRCRPERS